MDTSLKALERQRLEFNRSWKQTEFLLKAAAASADGAKNLHASALHFAVNVNLEQAAEDAIQAELDALRATDPRYHRRSAGLSR